PATANTSDPATATDVMFTLSSSGGGCSTLHELPSKWRIVPNVPTAQPCPAASKATAFSWACVIEIDCGSSVHTDPSQCRITPNGPTAYAELGPANATPSRAMCVARDGSGSISHPTDESKCRAVPPRPTARAPERPSPFELPGGTVTLINGFRL